jgi:hypothetical protein
VNTTTTRQVHPTQRLTAPDDTLADSEAEIVPLIQALWALGLITTSDSGARASRIRAVGIWRNNRRALQPPMWPGKHRDLPGY